MADIIQIRRDTAANWTSANPTLAQGELGIETDTDKFKVGDGSTAWTSIGYLINTSGYASYADSTANFTGTLQNSGSNVVVDTDIGATVQAYDANTTTSTNTQTLTNKTLTAPVLSGITTTASGSMEFAPANYTMVVRGGGSDEGSITLNCAVNTHGQTITSQPHSATVTNTMMLPAGADSTLVSLVSTDTLTNKTMVDTVYALSGLALLATNGGVQTKTVGGAITFTDSLVSGDAIVLMLEAGASYTVTWPTMTWVTSAGNVAPTLTAKDTIVLWKVGSVLYGAYTGSYV